MTAKEELNIILSKHRIDSIVGNITKSKKYINLLLSIKQETRFLDIKFPTISERIYCIMNGIAEIKICNNENCNILLQFKRYKLGYAKYCSNKCRSSSTENKELHIKTVNEKYGVENVFQTKYVKDKTKETCLDKYGTEYASSSKEVRYKVKLTNIEKYGVENTFQVEEYKEKSKQTCIIKYGVENYNQFSSKRNGYKWYKYILPSGKEINIQGYENRFLDEYFLNGGIESNILIENSDIEECIGKIWYHTKDGKIHGYYPDFYLIRENKIIEVKSIWTYNLQLDLNILKKESCLQYGLDFEFKFMNK